MKNQPPKFLLELVRWFCHPDLRTYVEGDLIELYQYHLSTYGRKRAILLFIKDLALLIRPSLLKNIEGSHRLNLFGVVQNHVKTAVRNLKKHALFTCINLIGLAVSMSVGILMILFHSELNSFDDFHQDGDRIYRVNSTYIGGAHGTEIKRPTASCFIGNELKSKAAGIDEVAVLIDDFQAELMTSERGIAICGFYASPSFHELFSFELLSGDPTTALSAPNGIVLTESTAFKLFGAEDPVGKVIEVQNNEYLTNVMVTGVLADPPHNSHLRFDALVSFSTLESQTATPYLQGLLDNPGELSDAHVYVRLHSGQDPKMIDHTLDQLMKSYNQTIEHPISHALQPLSSLVTSDEFVANVGPRFSGRKALTMIGLAIIVLLSACFNYTNLSLARALRRTKEVSVRKVNGATRGQIFTLFLTESLLLSFLAFGLGLFFFILLRPVFLELPNESSGSNSMFSLAIAGHHIPQFIGFALITGLLAGLMPAVFHSKVQAKQLFGKGINLKLYKRFSLRTALVATQFALSIGLITAAVLLKNQYEFVLRYDHGYNPEGILSVAVHGDYIDVLEEDCRQLPEVMGVSKSSWILGVGGKNLKVSIAESADRSNSTPFLMNQIDRDYLTMHGIDLLAGENFTKDLTSAAQAKELIVNEAFLEALNLGTPTEAIGKQLRYYGDLATIVGVAEETVSIGLTKKIFDPFAFIQTHDKTQYTSLNLKVNRSGLLETLEAIEKQYKELDYIYPFEASFYTDLIKNGYASRKGDFVVVSFLALLAIVISALGLLGMAVFITENRMKEFSIRKVLGAGRKELGYLLSKNFLGLSAIAGLVAIPSTIQLTNRYLLNDFWERAEIGIPEVFTGFGAVTLLGLCIIGWQLVRVLIKNPSDLLRDE